MSDKFFSDPNAEDQEIDKIKLGDKEYTQDQLKELVEIGEIGLESNRQYKTDVRKVWPNYQKVINENKSLKEQQSKLEEQSRSAAQERDFELHPDKAALAKQREEALRQAEELGIGPESIKRLAREVAREEAMQVNSGSKLLEDIKGVIGEMKEEGLPDTTADDIIAHMQETGIRNPKTAYKDMFEDDYIKNQAAKLSQIKGSGMPTIATSTAGAKQPAPTRITNANFDQLFSAAMNGEAIN